MRVIMSMAITLDGFIAKSNDDTSYLSEEGWAEFNNKVAEIGNLIMGHKTYDVMCSDGSIEAISGAKIVVLSSAVKGNDQAHFVSSPQEALSYLKGLGFEKVLLSGGAKTNSAFVREGLVDEVWLDVEPFLLGKGINLLDLDNIDMKLKFIDQKMLNTNVIQLRYEVKK